MTNPYLSSSEIPYFDLLLDSFSSEAYLSLNKNLLRMFGPNLAVYLCHLIDKYRYFRRNDLLNDREGFFLTNEEQMDELNLSVNQIRLLKKKLKELDIIETELIGAPPKEFYYLNMQGLLHGLNQDETDGPQFVENERVNPTRNERVNPTRNERDTIYNNNNKYNKNKNTVPSTKNTNRRKRTKQPVRSTNDKKSKTIDPVYKKLSDRLEKILRPLNKITSRSKLSSWPDTFRKLHQLDRIKIQRIRNVLIWYEDHIGEDFVPECFSATSFREKFIRLEAAQARSEKESGKTRTGGARVQKGKYSGRGMVYDTSSGELHDKE